MNHSVAFDAVALVPIQLLVAGSFTQTRIRLAVIDFLFTVHSGKSLLAKTLEKIDFVQTRCLILARIRLALINVVATSFSFVSRRANTGKFSWNFEFEAFYKFSVTLQSKKSFCWPFSSQIFETTPYTRIYSIYRYKLHQALNKDPNCTRSHLNRSLDP